MKHNRRKTAFDNMFEAFVKEGKELNLKEAKTLYPEEADRLRKEFSGSLGGAFRRMRKIYKNRWHEIYDTKTGIVHEAPKPVEEPVEESSKELTPLEKLRELSKKGKLGHE